MLKKPAHPGWLFVLQIVTACGLFVLIANCYSNVLQAFLTEPAAFDYGFTFSRILPSTSVLFGVYYVLTNTLQAMGAATPSLIINLSRQGLICIPALFLLKALLGITGLIWAQPAADMLSLLLAVVLYVPRCRKMVRRQ